MPIIDAQPLTTPAQLAIVVSRFNHEITESLLHGAEQRLKQQGILACYTVWVPGAIEIPVTLQRLAHSGRYEAIIALGAVIRGETDHYDYVCGQVSQGCQQIALQYHLPVIFGVLTTDNEEQAWARAGGAEGHKGVEAVDAALHMVSLFRQLP